MKKIILSLAILSLLSFSNTFADYDNELDKNPIFMEKVYDFINTNDISDSKQLGYCEEVYIEATRRREYTQNESDICGEYFTQKNNQEKTYMYYMLNNRELFY